MRSETFGEAVSVPPAKAIASSLRSFSERARGYGTGWFTELVAGYLKWREARDRHVAVSDELSAEEHAQTIIRQACVRTALTGAAAGSLATGATVVTQETGGVGAFLAIPAGLLALGTEMAARAILHLEMTCDLAEVFGVPFDPDDPEDLWRLYALVFHAEQQTDGVKNADRELLHRIIDPEDDEIGSFIGGKLLKESVLRNVVPFLGIATSAATNWRVTRTVGDSVRRYCRYRRALVDVLDRHPRLRNEHIDLVLEGVWFVFSSDGTLTIEEAAILAKLLRKSPPSRRRALENRLTAKRTSWLKRLGEIPPRDRKAMFALLEVAAAMDKAYSEPEQEILAEAADALGIRSDPRHVSDIVQQLEEVGIFMPELRRGGRA